MKCIKLQQNWELIVAKQRTLRTISLIHILANQHRMAMNWRAISMQQNVVGVTSMPRTIRCNTDRPLKRLMQLYLRKHSTRMCYQVGLQLMCVIVCEFRRWLCCNSECERATSIGRGVCVVLSGVLRLRGDCQYEVPFFYSLVVIVMCSQWQTPNIRLRVCTRDSSPDAAKARDLKNCAVVPTKAGAVTATLP